MQIDISMTQEEIRNAVLEWLAKTAPDLRVSEVTFKVSRTGSGTAVAAVIDADFGNNAKPDVSKPTKRAAEPEAKVETKDTTDEIESDVRAEHTKVGDLLDLAQDT